MVRERLESLLAAVPGVRIVGRAGRAREAISGILAARPDLVLLDVQLAEGSGFEVLRAVHERAPEIDFYMLSNFSSEPYWRLAADLGAQDYFDKSKDFERVRELIAERAASQH